MSLSFSAGAGAASTSIQPSMLSLSVGVSAGAVVSVVLRVSCRRGWRGVRSQVGRRPVLADFGDPVGDGFEEVGVVAAVERDGLGPDLDVGADAVDVGDGGVGAFLRDDAAGEVG